eukprot:TRINITY_DN487_c0_g4_i1.p1 TRINITY_DN487_c0_g4~~TRINITY_DN487_c0_g4_i1.p1  ORF type:complete len:706 (+),score=236.34 TRINITY_DN487_c0_g4_i1:72-2120(+)
MRPPRRAAGLLPSARSAGFGVLVTFLNVYIGWARERQLRSYDALLQRRAAELTEHSLAPCPACPECPDAGEPGPAGGGTPCPAPDCPRCPSDSTAAQAAEAAASGALRKGRVRVPCPAGCRGRGDCDDATGVCRCRRPWAGRACSLSAARPEHETVAVLLPRAGRSARDRAAWLREFRKAHSGVLVVASAGADLEPEAGEDTALSLVRAPAPTLGGELSALLRARGDRELVLVVADSGGFGAETNLSMAVEMLRTTDAEIVGGLQVMPDGLLVTPCWEIVHQRWHIRHRRAPLGYLRHERFVMYCDRTSNTFLASAAALERLGGFNATHDDLAIADLFVRIRTRNAAAARRAAAAEDTALATLARVAPTRLPGWTMVGTVAEVLYPTVPLLDERLTQPFAEQHQAEAYWRTDGTLAPPGVVCVKSGGALQHSVEGHYSPLCHRYTRQRDFVAIYDLWTDAGFAPPSGIDDPSSLRYAVSVHHGNLFGALRLGAELLWETDGDLDFVSFNLTNAQLQERARALVEELRRRGYGVKVPHPAKPWYINLLRNKTDFQISLRSTRDPRTAGKPPHVHTVSLLYQGRRVFVNGFSNPWRGIRADPGHDYREHYLAQQGWVLHFTDESVNCKDGSHNACLPPCNSWAWRLDHNYCTDSIEPNYRDPYLWFDERERANPVWSRQLDAFR